MSLTFRGTRKTVESGKTYLGVVEDNNDPEKLCRCRIRVFDVHDGMDNDNTYTIKTENLPWALPWKDLNGNVTNIPDLGKVVVVVFENGNHQNPEYIHSKHYNTNLEQKLESLSEKDYLSMKSLLFDHKTQIYVNDTEGLKIDHKFNNINITDKSIDVNLKDNFGKINLGTSKSEQRAILGDNFTEWFDKFLNLMLTNRAFIGNFAAPIVPSPALMKHIQLYKSIKDPKILSKNVYIVDNDYVEKLDRIADPTIGDNWKSTLEDNKITKKEEIDYQSESGSSATTFTEDPNGLNKSTTNNPNVSTPPKKEVHPDVKILHRLLKTKNYLIYKDINKLNIVTVRNQCLSPRDEYTDSFVDKLYIMYKDENVEWVINKFPFSTVPGTEFTLTKQILDANIGSDSKERVKRLGVESYINERITTKKFYQLINSVNGTERSLSILAPSQYIDSFELSEDSGRRVLQSRNESKFLIWRDTSFDRPEFVPNEISKPIKTDRLFRLDKGFPGGVNVGHWGIDGNQLFSSLKDMESFNDLCGKHQSIHGNSFTYTLVTKQDWENAVVEQKANPDEPILDEEKPVNDKEIVVEDKPEQVPQELNTKTKILAYQVWNNKQNGTRIPEDSSWNEQSKSEWEKTKDLFLLKVMPSEDENIWLGFARLSPFGNTYLLDNSSDVYGYKSNFSNNVYTIVLRPNSEFVITKNVDDTILEIAKGTFSDGCKTISPTTGNYKGQTFKDDVAWTNIKKLV